MRYIFKQYPAKKPKRKIADWIWRSGVECGFCNAGVPTGDAR